MIIWNATLFGPVQKSPSSPALSHVEGEATAIFAAGAYTEYVSTEKWRERSWRLFSTGPSCSGYRKKSLIAREERTIQRNKTQLAEMRPMLPTA
ncbi:MAG: hypothetical protein ABI618_08625 [Nitrospirota bacterium]